jgi:micrococcal nuclease
MKRLAAFAIAILLVALAVYYVVANLPGAVDGSTGSGEKPGGSNSDDPATASEIQKPADATLSHVAYVHDGDTLYLQPDGTTSRADEITVRLIGIDTPELRPSAECYAIEARDRLRALLPQGAAVWIAEDEGALDQYGRSLLYLWTTSGVSVNLDLVENGYASALRIAPSDTYWRQFAAAETAAMAADRGMWGQC